MPWCWRHLRYGPIMGFESSHSAGSFILLTICAVGERIIYDLKYDHTRFKEHYSTLAAGFILRIKHHRNLWATIVVEDLESMDQHLHVQPRTDESRKLSRPSIILGECTKCNLSLMQHGKKTPNMILKLQGTSGHCCG
jgi:hypothetical protein